MTKQVVGELDQRAAHHVTELMAHQLATQQAYYVAVQDTQDKIRARNLLAYVLCKVGLVNNMIIPLKLKSINNKMWNFYFVIIRCDHECMLIF